MIKLLLYVNILLTCIMPFAWAQEDVFKVAYGCYDSTGSLRWKAETEIYASPEKGKNICTLVETGSGCYSGFEGRVLWKSELEYIDKQGTIYPVNSLTRTTDASGSTIAIEENSFDYANHTVTCKHEDTASGKTRARVFKFRHDIVNRLTLALYIQRFLESGKEQATLEILNSQPRLIKCRLYVVDKEEIVSCNEKKQSYKMCLDPELGLLDIVKVLIPKSYVWHSACDGHEWLKYKGLEEDLGSPIVEIRKEPCL
jgi:hypothetical protein